MTGPGQNLGGVARGGGADFGRRRAVRVARPRPAVPLPSLLVVTVFFTTHNGGGGRRRGPAEPPTPTPGPTGPTSTQACEHRRAVTGGGVLAPSPAPAAEAGRAAGCGAGTSCTSRARCGPCPTSARACPRRWPASSRCTCATTPCTRRRAARTVGMRAREGADAEEVRFARAGGPEAPVPHCAAASQPAHRCSEPLFIIWSNARRRAPAPSAQIYDGGKEDINPLLAGVSRSRPGGRSPAQIGERQSSVPSGSRKAGPKPVSRP